MNYYQEIWADALEQLNNTWSDPAAYAAAKENYFKVFEELAAADIRLFEDGRPSIYEPMYINKETVADMAREVEILHRVNYPLVDDYERDYLEIKDWFTAR